MSNFTIIIDTREQRPWRFPNGAETVRGTLTTGDYSVVGLEDKVTIERKSLADLYNTAGQNRGRFERELERMRSFDFAAIIIEATWEDIARRPPPRSEMRPKSVIRSLMAWAQRYKVHVIPAGGPALAARLAYILLDRYFRDAESNRQVEGAP
jgi:ERCC4-type nuclease